MNKLKEYFLWEIAKSQTGPFGSQLHESDYVEFGTPMVTVEHLGIEEFLLENLPKVSDEDKERLSKYVLKEGDIVFSRVGSIDRCTYVSKNEDGWMFSGRCICVRANSKVNPRYLNFYFRQEHFKKMMLNISVGATMPSLNTKLMDGIKVYLPDLRTQNNVSYLLSNIDDKIKLNNRINRELEQMAKLLYDYWFVQFDFPDANGKPYKSSGGKMVFNKELIREIPEGWRFCYLKDIVEKTGTGLNPRDNFVLGEGENYYVTIKNIEQGRIILNEKCDRISDESLKIIDKRSDLEKGDILFTSIEPVGTTYLLSEKPKNWNINESVFMIRPDYNKVTSEFLYMFLSSDYIKAYTKNASAGSIHKGIRHSTLKECKVVLPQLKMINSFTNIMLPILEKLDKIQKENHRLTTLRDWLLPMLMNGQVRVGEVSNKEYQTDEGELSMVTEPK